MQVATHCQKQHESRGANDDGDARRDQLRATVPLRARMRPRGLYTQAGRERRHLNLPWSPGHKREVRVRRHRAE
eukprot:8834637-Pyramimonas_sp.AAC.1